MGFARVVAAAACAAVTAGTVVPATAEPADARLRQHSVHRVAVDGGPFPMTWAWDPEEIEIARRDRVVWINPTSSGHHVTPYEGPWADEATRHVASNGGRASYRFRRPGVYKYRCDITYHSMMIGDRCLGQCGVIVVE